KNKERDGRTMVFFFSSRRRHTRWPRDWSSDVCSSDLIRAKAAMAVWPRDAHEATVANRMIVLDKSDPAAIGGNANVAKPGGRFVTHRTDGIFQTSFATGVVVVSDSKRPVRTPIGRFDLVHNWARSAT